MPQNTHLEAASTDARRMPEPVRALRNPELIHAKAAELARTLMWLPDVTTSHTFADRTRAVARSLKPIFTALDRPAPKSPASDDFTWLYDNGRLVYAELQNMFSALKSLKKLPHVRNAKGATVPRVLAIAEGFLEAVSSEFSEQEFTLFVEVFQKTTALTLRELWSLMPALRLALLEEIAASGGRLVNNPSDNSIGVSTAIRSLRDVGHTTWKDVLEPLMAIDLVLRQDPSDAYGRMDFDSRDLYRNRIADIAEYSDYSEVDTARKAVALAADASRRSYEDPRIALRESHVGYYLVDKGAQLLHEKVRYRPRFFQKIRALVRQHPDEFFLTGIALLALIIVSTAAIILTESNNSPALVLFSLLILFLPSSQSAVQLMNYLVSLLLPAEILQKLDFMDGVPVDCVTLVAIPTLLLNETQVRELVENLEVRFLGNHDPNIYFALLTDLADSRELAREDNPLITLCSDLIQELNLKYAGQGAGSFFLLHRHRVYNPRERAWMGWERKRGKLLDLNKLLRNEYDSFPVKVGDLAILPKVRFVITLDADTELPRGAAHRMIGAMAHPLNQAIIDPEKNIVVAGYGILQPRVGVSVQSAAKSRLASIYSGETGFDIYTRAVSDVYQDLYGEGSFAGKGIYEVDTLHQVLDRRFPRNALLSHDLIEGAYARAGLATDIEIIEDYPSHYSAYNRRKHRWLRGDWQITEWLLPRVPEESGSLVPNPISVISQWKILDNLRRSLVEPATFLLLVLGWLVLPGTPLFWTLATIVILLIPAWFRCLFDLVRAVVEDKMAIARDAMSVLFASNVGIFLTLTFLANQMLLSLDAVARALIRRMVTRERLLEWETAAEVEMGTARRTALDIYLDWTPVLAIAIGGLTFFVRRNALPVALPMLVLWAGSKPLSLWLNRPPRAAHNEASEADKIFLRRAALRTWRYFAEFSTKEHNWLVPDNVQDKPPAIAAR